MKTQKLWVLLLLTTIKAIGQVSALRWKRVGRLHWVESQRKAEKGLGLIEVQLHLVNPCDFIDDAIQIDLEQRSRFGFAGNATKRIIELCNQDYEAEWLPKLEKFSKCHSEYLTWRQKLRRIAKRFVIWVGIAVVLLVVAISAITTSYVVSKTKFDNMQESLDAAKGKLNELHEKFTIQEEINNRTLEVLSKVGQDTNELLVLVDELDQFLPDLQWTSMKVHHRLMGNIDLMTEMTATCRQGRVNIPALAKFLRTDTLADYTSQDSEIESITMVNPSLVRILFTHPIVDPDTVVYNVHAFKTYFNSTGDEKVLVYTGPTTLIHNHKMNCTKAVEVGEGPVYDKCEDQSYEDPSLKSYELENVPSEPMRPQILKTSTSSIIYCLYHNISIETEETACIPDVIELPKLVPFKTQGLQHQVSLILMNSTREVVQPRIREFNETFHEDARHNTLGYLNSIKELNKKLAEASRYNVKAWFEGILTEPNNTLWLGAAIIAGVIFLSYRCTTCTERSTGVTVVNTTPMAPPYDQLYPTRSLGLGKSNPQASGCPASDQEMSEIVGGEACPLHAHQVEGEC